MRIVPCRTLISDRFPVASFVVNVPPTRCFEVVCTTDPALLHPDYYGRRRPENFFTTGDRGLLRAAAGEATLLLPGEHLSRFAGAERLYYALGTYGNPRGDQAQLSTQDLSRVPYIRLSKDFTGKTLSPRWGKAQGSGRYGAAKSNSATGKPKPRLTWGGDAVFQKATAQPTATRSVATQRGAVQSDRGLGPRAGAFRGPSAASPPQARWSAPITPYRGDYDDGFDPTLWRRAETSASAGLAYGRGSGSGRGPGRTQTGATRTAAVSRGPSRRAPAYAGSSSSMSMGHRPENRGSAGFEGFEDGAAVLASGGRPHGVGRASHTSTSYGESTAWFEQQRSGHASALSPQRRPSSRSSANAIGDRSTSHGFEDAVAVARSRGYGNAAQPAPTTDVSSPLTPEPMQPEPMQPEVTQPEVTPSEPLPPQEPLPPREPLPPSMAPVTSPPLTPKPDVAAPVVPTPPSDTALTPAGIPLTIPEKFRIISQVAPLVSGQELYSAVRLNSDGNGLSWGMILFSQRSGDLGRVLAAAHRRDPTAFAAAFGPHAGTLLELTGSGSEEVRMQPVGGRELWDDADVEGQTSWPARFRDAGHAQPMRAAQHEVAIEGYLDPNLRFARGFGLNTDRALALLYALAVELGSERAQQWLAERVGPLNAPELQQQALQALGHASLLDFQQSVEGLIASGEWDASTHAAVLDALRREAVDAGIFLPRVDETLTSVVAAAEAEQLTVASRLAGLLEDRSGLFDTTFDLSLL